MSAALAARAGRPATRMQCQVRCMSWVEQPSAAAAQMAERNRLKLANVHDMNAAAGTSWMWLSVPRAQVAIELPAWREFAPGRRREHMLLIRGLQCNGLVMKTTLRRQYFR